MVDADACSLSPAFNINSVKTSVTHAWAAGTRFRAAEALRRAVNASTALVAMLLADVVRFALRQVNGRIDVWSWHVSWLFRLIIWFIWVGFGLI